MASESNTGSLKLVNEQFLARIKIGDRLFHYPRKGTAEESFEESSSAEHTLYTVIDIPDGTDIVMVRAFDKNEDRQHFSRKQLLAGDWWYNPDFKV